MCAVIVISYQAARVCITHIFHSISIVKSRAMVCRFMCVTLAYGGEFI